MTPPRPSSVELVPFEPAHAEAAAVLVATRVRALREAVPALPESWTAEAPLARLLTELAVRGAGVAALVGGRLVGFQAATLIDGHGGRWAYTPDFGHGAADDPEGRLIEAMYARLAEGWAHGACLEHVVTALVNDGVAIATFGRIGFGQSVIDLVRDLGPVEACAPLAGVVVRRADHRDTPAVMGLDDALRRHLSASPVFLPHAPARAPELVRRILADPAQATYLAEADGATVAMLRIGPSATDVATVVRDPATASITSAFTVEDRRGDGIATLLLDAAVGWAREQGYARAAVDHESANGEAFRFWGRHFTPVAISFARRLPAWVAG